MDKLEGAHAQLFRYTKGGRKDADENVYKSVVKSIESESMTAVPALVPFLPGNLVDDPSNDIR